MFGLFKGTKDFINLGNTFCLVNRALTDLIPKVYLASDKSEHNEAVMSLAYACKAGINDRLEKHGWPLHSGISVPSMDRKNVTILEAIHKTVGVLRDLAANMDLEYEVEEILEGGKLFHVLDRTCPKAFKDRIGL
ncbi:hypothetical protein HNQ93_004428 [Hymenobacter luteus]|uniref:Uncharacterized protein n=2 Tax=Hymenobacter TaxID=89966 RepID=A0A7W9T4Q0_9BACT|nr:MULTISPECIES: hypothetical protein [Hymenobacter]MBB4603766.1 hypothetical protein [Hymenobacter latericoloratus]MBB6061547.1 hypothetical protein [Hymenobacter luteus]